MIKIRNKNNNNNYNYNDFNYNLKVFKLLNPNSRKEFIIQNNELKY